MKKKRILILIAFLLLIFIPSNVLAAPQENDNGAANGIFAGEHMKMPDDSDAYYEIDTAEKTQEEFEQGIGSDFMDAVQGLSPWKMAQNNATAVMDIAVDNIFKFNQQMVNLMIGVLNFGFNLSVMDSFIDMVDSAVKDIAGISGAQIGGGIFGTFINFAIVSAGIATAFHLIARKSSISAFQVMGKSIIALSISMILIGNFGVLMKGMNDVTTWVSASALTGTTNFLTSDNRSTDEMMGAVNRNMWDLFIGKPYLVMQYGTDDIEMIGNARVDELLRMKPGEDRDDYVQETEVGELGNANMTIPNSGERLGFTVLYSVVNMIVSIPVYGIAFLHVILGFWFLLIAFLAPFATIFSVFPGQFKVLQRYAVELVYPLFLKVLVSFVMVFIFGIGFVAYSLPAAAGMPQYFSAAIFQFALFALLFLLRKRIKHIFSAAEFGPMNRVAESTRDLRNSVDSLNSGLGKAGRFAIHAAVGVATGGATVGASSTVEKMVALKQAKKREEKSMSTPTASVKTSKTASGQNMSTPTSEVKKKETAAPEVKTVVHDNNLSKPFAVSKEKVMVKEEKDETDKEREVK